MYFLNFWSYKALNFVPVLDLCQGDDPWYVRSQREREREREHGRHGYLFGVLQCPPSPVLVHLCCGRCVGALATARVAFAMTVRMCPHFIKREQQCVVAEALCWCWSFPSSKVFHGLMALLMIRVQNSSDFRASIQDGWWLIKLLAIAGLTVAAFFIPNQFFVVFSTKLSL